MSRTVQGLVLAAVTAGVLAMLFAWPVDAAPAGKPDKCLSIGLPVTGPGAGGSTVGCVPPAPKAPPPPPPPPPTTPPPPPPRTPAPPPPAPPAPAVLPRPAVVVAPVPTTVPIPTVPTTRPTTRPPRATTTEPAIHVAAPAPLVSTAQEARTQRRWGLAALVLLIGGGAAAARVRANRER